MAPASLVLLVLAVTLTAASAAAASAADTHHYGPPSPPPIKPWAPCPLGSVLASCPEWKACVSNPSHCTTLDLSGRALTGTIPPSIARLNATQELLLHDNRLSGQIPSEIGQMVSLAWLFLHNNNLSGAGDGVCSIAGPHPVNSGKRGLKYGCSLAGNPFLGGQNCPVCLQAGLCNTASFPLPPAHPCTRNSSSSHPHLLADRPPPAGTLPPSQRQEQQQPAALLPTVTAVADVAEQSAGGRARGQVNRREELNHTVHIPFSWATLPRYTFCGNASGLLNKRAQQYVSQHGGPINLIGDHSSYRYPAEDTVSQQANIMRGANPAQQQWAYYAIDLVRDEFRTGAYMLNHSDECLLKGKDGNPVPRPVYGFDGGAGSCGVEKWLQGVQEMIDKGGIQGIFLDGFQSCDPFFDSTVPGHKAGAGCARVCTANGGVGCAPGVQEKWNRGLREAMWRLKKMLGKNGSLICNSTPGPYTCGISQNPVRDCPCDGTNDERGGGNFLHQHFVGEIDATLGDYALLVHVPHADVLPTFKNSVPRFLMSAEKYMYHGSGFGYSCDDGWLSTDPAVLTSYSAPLGPPLGPAKESAGCCDKKRCPDIAPGTPCVRSRVFESGTKAFVNYTGGESCMIWSNGLNISTPGRDKEVDGCTAASSWKF